MLSNEEGKYFELKISSAGLFLRDIPSVQQANGVLAGYLCFQMSISVKEPSRLPHHYIVNAKAILAPVSASQPIMKVDIVPTSV